MDKIGLMLCMSDDNFMLQVTCDLPKKYEAVLINPENRLITVSSEKLTVELMPLNAFFKRFQSKKEVEEEEKVLAVTKKQVEEKALAV